MSVNTIFLDDKELSNVIIESDSQGNNKINSLNILKYNKLISSKSAVLPKNVAYVKGSKLCDVVIINSWAGNNFIKDIDEPKIEDESNDRNIFEETLLKLQGDSVAYIKRAQNYLNEKQNSIQKLLKSSRIYFCEKNYVKANEALGSAYSRIENDPYPDEFMLRKFDKFAIKWTMALCKYQEKKFGPLKTATEILTPLISSYGEQFPTLYCNLAECFYSLAYYDKAVDVLDDGLKVIAGCKKMTELNWPGTTDKLVKENEKAVVEKSMRLLLKECKAVGPPDVTCCYPECNSDCKYMYFNTLSFGGYVNVKCSQKCSFNYHRSCWKMKLRSDGWKKANAILNKLCMTDDCGGFNSEITIYDEQLFVNSVIRARSESESAKSDKNVVGGVKETKTGSRQGSRKKKNGASECSSKNDDISLQNQLETAKTENGALKAASTKTLNSDAKEYVPRSYSNFSQSNEAEFCINVKDINLSEANDQTRTLPDAKLTEKTTSFVSVETLVPGSNGAVANLPCTFASRSSNADQSQEESSRENSKTEDDNDVKKFFHKIVTSKLNTNAKEYVPPTAEQKTVDSSGLKVNTSEFVPSSQAGNGRKSAARRKFAVENAVHFENNKHSVPDLDLSQTREFILPNGEKNEGPSDLKQDTLEFLSGDQNPPPKSTLKEIFAADKVPFLDLVDQSVPTPDYAISPRETIPPNVEKKEYGLPRTEKVVVELPALKIDTPEFVPSNQTGTKSKCRPKEVFEANRTTLPASMKHPAPNSRLDINSKEYVPQAAEKKIVEPPDLKIEAKYLIKDLFGADNSVPLFGAQNLTLESCPDYGMFSDLNVECETIGSFNSCMSSVPAEFLPDSRNGVIPELPLWYPYMFSPNSSVPPKRNISQPRKSSAIPIKPQTIDRSLQTDTVQNYSVSTQYDTVVREQATQANFKNACCQHTVILKSELNILRNELFQTEDAYNNLLDKYKSLQEILRYNYVMTQTSFAQEETSTQTDLCQVKELLEMVEKMEAVRKNMLTEINMLKSDLRIERDKSEALTKTTRDVIEQNNDLKQKLREASSDANMIHLRKTIIEETYYLRNLLATHYSMNETKCKHVLWELDSLKPLLRPDSIPSPSEVDENRMCWSAALNDAVGFNRTLADFYENFFKQFETQNPKIQGLSRAGFRLMGEPPNIFLTHFKTVLTLNSKLEQDFRNHMEAFYRMAKFSANAQKYTASVGDISDSSFMRSEPEMSTGEKLQNYFSPLTAKTPEVRDLEIFDFKSENSDTGDNKSKNSGISCQELSNVSPKATGGSFNASCSSEVDTLKPGTSFAAKGAVPKRKNEEAAPETSFTLDKNMPRNEVTEKKSEISPGKPVPRVGGSQALVLKLQQTFPLVSPKLLSEAVYLTRERHGGLTGLSSKEILMEVKKTLKELSPKEKPEIQGSSRPVQQQQPQAWGKVNNGGILWHNRNPDKNCSICFETMDKTTSVQLRCQHIFHINCIKQWLQTDSICPICRSFTTLDEEFPPLM